MPRSLDGNPALLPRTTPATQNCEDSERNPGIVRAPIVTVDSRGLAKAQRRARINRGSRVSFQMTPEERSLFRRNLCYNTKFLLHSERAKRTICLNLSQSSTLTHGRYQQTIHPLSGGHCVARIWLSSLSVLPK